MKGFSGFGLVSLGIGSSGRGFTGLGFRVRATGLGLGV